MIQMQIWLLLADVYLAVDQPNEALNCIQEAQLINPMSHHIMFMVSRIFFKPNWTKFFFKHRQQPLTKKIILVKCFG